MATNSNDATGTAVALLPTPHRIAQNLESIEQLVEDGDENSVKMAKRMLRQAAANVRLLFELQADPATGEFRLQNYGQAWMLADLLYEAKMVPRGYDKPEQVVVALMKATEIGVSPITGLANIMIVNNRPSVWGDLAQALVERSGQVERQKKERLGPEPTPGLELDLWDPMTGWKVSTWRKGQDEPYAGEYTVEKARRANLWMDKNRKPWITDPDQMLFNRARARSLKNGFADCLLGMGIIEEQADYEAHPLHAVAEEPRRLVPPADDEPITQSESQPDSGGVELRSYENREPAPVAEERVDTGEAGSEDRNDGNGDPPRLV